MPYQIATGSLMEVGIRGRHFGQRTLSVLHYQYISTSLLSDGRQALIDFMNKLGEAGGLLVKYRDCCSAVWTMEEVRAQWIFPLRYVYEQSTTGTGDGTVAGNSLPPNSSVTLYKRSELAGRHNRGFVHMPGVPLTFVTEGVLSTTGLAAYAALCTKLKTVIDVTGGPSYQPVILNRSQPAISVFVNSCLPMGTARTQRRRTVGLGE